MNVTSLYTAEVSYGETEIFVDGVHIPPGVSYPDPDEILVQARDVTTHEMVWYNVGGEKSVEIVDTLTRVGIHKKIHATIKIEENNGEARKSIIACMYRV